MTGLAEIGSHAVDRVAGWIRLGHPFPSLLNGVAAGSLVVLAGGDGELAVRLAAAMVALQLSIGAINDLVDAERDRGRKHGKPIPAGLVSPAGALTAAVVTGLAGLAIAATAGLATFAIAVTGLTAGYAYDVRFKGTALAWLPFSIGIPLVPLYAWLGATDAVPAAFAVLLPVAALAGAALSLANGLADLERDGASATYSPAVRLGPRRAWLVLALLQFVVVAAAVASLALLGGRGVGVFVTVAAGAAVLVGAGLGRPATRPGLREVAWEIQAVATGGMAAGWAAALIEAGRL